MRKVMYMLVFIIVVLGVAFTVPVYAAAPNYNQGAWPWYWFNGPVPNLSEVPSQPRAPRPVQNPAPGTGANTNVSNRDLTPDESYIFKQVNSERAKIGLPALQIDYRLVQTARAKSRDMINGRYFDHQSPTLGSPFDQMKKAGISYRYAGENIAGNPSAAGAMVSWMHSSGHKANILSQNFKRIGIGVIDGGMYGKMLTQQFIG